MIDPTSLALAGQIVAAYASQNRINDGEIPALIDAVSRILVALSAGREPETRSPEPAVPPKKSVFPDYIVCLEDGKKLKMLKRHLRTAYGMTPEQYRKRWNLPPSYPMTAPSYAEQRSILAKEFGLGQSREKGS